MENRTGFSQWHCTKIGQILYEWRWLEFVSVDLGFPCVPDSVSSTQLLLIPMDWALLPGWVNSEHPPASLEALEQVQTPLQLQGTWWLSLGWLWEGFLQQIWAMSMAWAVFKPKYGCAQSSSIKTPRTPQENGEIPHGFGGAGFHHPGARLPIPASEFYWLCSLHWWEEPLL